MQITTTTLDQIFNIVTSLALMQLFSRYKPTDTILLILRISYILSQLSLLILLFVIKKRILKVNDKRTFLVEENNNQRQTFSEYDKNEHTKLLRSTVLQIPIVLFLHFKFGLPQPLAVQIFNAVRSVFLNPLFMAYLWRESVYRVKRPYEESLVFGQEEVESDESEKVVEKEEKESEEKVVEKESEKVGEKESKEEVEKVTEKENVEHESEKKIED